MKNWIDKGDTLNKNDLVYQQYNLLPYPEFNEEKLMLEQNHYQKNVQDPIIAYPGVTLENCNNFLYRGKEDYR